MYPDRPGLQDYADEKREAETFLRSQCLGS